MVATKNNTRPSDLAFQGRSVERVPTPDEGAHVNDTPLSRDAEEFGIYARSGGWRLGLLVARNVERNTGTGRSVATTTLGKVSARAFAEQSGTSADRVLRYLDAWDRAAEAGHVPPAADLRPGIEFDLPAQETVRWADFYDAGRSSNEASVKRSLPALGRAAEADPEFAEQAAEKAAEGMTPAAKARLAAGLLSDDDVAEALSQDARSESAVRAATKNISAERTKGSEERTPAKVLGHKIETLARMASARRAYGKALTEVQALEVAERSEIGNLVAAELDRIDAITGWFRALMEEQASTWDEALAVLLSEDEAR